MAAAGSDRDQPERACRAAFLVTCLLACLLSLTLASVSWPEDLDAAAA